MKFIPGMRGFVMARAKGGWFAGIDERTAILGDGTDWLVYGLGSAHLRLNGTTRRFGAGDRFSTPS